MQTDGGVFDKVGQLTLASTQLFQSVQLPKRALRNDIVCSHQDYLTPDSMQERLGRASTELINKREDALYEVIQRCTSVMSNQGERVFREVMRWEV